MLPLSISSCICSLVMPVFAPPPFPFFLDAACTPKVASVPVKTDAMKVGSSFCSGIPRAGGKLDIGKSENTTRPNKNTQTHKRR